MEITVESNSFFDRRKRSLLALAVTLSILIVIAGTVAAMSQKKDPSNKAAAPAGKTAKGEKEKAPVPVSVASVAVAPVSSYISATANLVAEQEVKIVAETEGRIARLQVEEGVWVREGQTLATLVRDDAEIALAKATVRAKNARVAFGRANEMMSGNIMSRDGYDKTVMEKDVAEQELAEAKWRLGRTTIAAPFSGRITERFVSQGQHLRPGDSLFSLADFDPLVARLYLPEKDVLSLTRGKAVRIRMKSAEEITFEGRIRQISDVVDPATGTVKVTVEAVTPPESVRSGAFVIVDIIRETRPNAVVVPRESVVRELRDAHVFVADGNVAKRRAVTLGLEEGSNVQTLTGLKPGERVVIAGQGGLRDGSAIKVIP